MTDAIYTIGHSSHPVEKLVGLLLGHQVTAVGDVRSHPYSRMHPQFNRESLAASLAEAGIRYVFLGQDLGARPDDRRCYRRGHVQFDLLSASGPFLRGIERVIEGLRTFTIALLCAEKEPLDCHRTILIARKLAEKGLAVRHILEDGRIETHEQAIERLIERLRLPREDMFRTTREVVDEAYVRQGEDIAYREPEAAMAASSVPLR